MRRFTALATAAALALVPALALANPDAGNATADGRYVAPNGPPPDATAGLQGQAMTEAQARGVLSAHGYTAVSGLARAQDGSWRGRAMHNGAVGEVGVDARGRVVIN